MQVVQCLSNHLQAAYDRVRMLGLARIRHHHNQEVAQGTENGNPFANTSP
jgi:hypothetical protein